MYYLIIGVLSYILFVFISESFNPFVKTKIRFNRPKWRLGRRIAFIVASFSWLFLFLRSIISGKEIVLGGGFVALAVLLIVFCIWRYREQTSGV